MSITTEELMDIISSVFGEFPVIDGIFDKFGKEYILRQHRLSDASEYYKFYTKPEVAKFLPDGLVFKNIEEAESEIKYRVGNFYNRETVYWAVVEKETDKLIGGCGFLDWSKYNARIEVAYDLNPEYWNRGIMKAAIPHVFAFAFLKMRVMRLQATTVLDNPKSIQLLQKNFGFTLEGVLRRYKFWKGQFIDVNMFSLTLEDFVKYAKQGHYPFLNHPQIKTLQIYLSNKPLG